MTLKQLRTEKGITQAKCAELFQVSLRTYKRYESNETKINPLKYQYLLQRLSEYGRIDEDHGILSIDQIKKNMWRNIQGLFCGILLPIWILCQRQSDRKKRCRFACRNAS